MSDHPPTRANVPEPASGFKRVNKPDPEAFSNLEEEPGYIDRMHEETLGDPNKITAGMWVMFTLLIIFVAGMVLFLLLIIVYPDQFSPKDWIGATGDKKISGVNDRQPNAAAFKLGGVALRMIPSAVKDIYPSLTMTPDPGGGRMGSFTHHEGEYQVTFKGLEHGEQAFRIQSSHLFRKISYLDLLSELSTRYGQPNGSDCTADDKGVSIQCNLFWKLPGVRLTAEIKTAVAKNGDTARTRLTVTALDLHPGNGASTIGQRKPKRELKDLNF